MDVAKILWMSLVKHSVCQSFTSNIDCIFNFSLKQVVLAWFNRKGRETEEKWWSNMPNNFRCLISNASGLIIQATSQYTALDIFQRSLRWLQRQPAQELIALPGLYCASRGKQDNKAGSPWDMVVSEAEFPGRHSAAWSVKMLLPLLHPFASTFGNAYDEEFHLFRHYRGGGKV